MVLTEDSIPYRKVRFPDPGNTGKTRFSAENRTRAQNPATGARSVPHDPEFAPECQICG